MIALASHHRPDHTRRPQTQRATPPRLADDPAPKPVETDDASPYPLPSEALDLRRSLHRDHAELIIARAQALPAPDRALLEAVYNEGLPVSRLAGLRNECPRALRRRLRRLLSRVLSPRFGFVLARRASWPAYRRKVANAVVIRGLSLRVAARLLGSTLHNVRLEVQRIDALFDAAVSENGGRS